MFVRLTDIVLRLGRKLRCRRLSEWLSWVVSSELSLFHGVHVLYAGAFRRHVDTERVKAKLCLTDNHKALTTLRVTGDFGNSEPGSPKEDYCSACKMRAELHVLPILSIDAARL
jgi:hypothetical protein